MKGSLLLPGVARRCSNHKIDLNMQSSCEQEKAGAAVPIDIVLVNKLDHVEETSHPTEEIKQIQPDQPRQSEKTQSVNEHSVKDLHTEYLKLTNKFSTKKQSQPAATKYSTTIPFTQLIESDKISSQTKSGYQNIFLDVVTTAETLQHNVADMFLSATQKGHPGTAMRDKSTLVLSNTDQYVTPLPSVQLHKVAYDDVDYHKQSSLAKSMLSTAPTANGNIKQKTLDINLEDDTVKMTEVRIIPEHRASLSIRAHPPWDKYIYLPLPKAHIGTGTMVQEGVTYPGPEMAWYTHALSNELPKSYPVHRVILHSYFKAPYVMDVQKLSATYE
uniref:Uncharacterized protein n=1 Tax=Timema bartmani TaxID=61472 RepID=A0A7R9F0U1_9NEOP|nr:unnamed protein product [Timema bartmani]